MRPPRSSSSSKQYERDASHTWMIAGLLAAAALLLFTQLTSVQGQDYDELLTNFCENFTDINICLTNESHDNCYCDELCAVYDDCCVDGGQVTPRVGLGGQASRHANQYPVHLAREVVDCTTLHGETNVGQGKFLVVSRCPDSSYTSPHIKHLCQSVSEEHFLNLPVTGNLTHILYKNIYCAVCNSEPNIIYWTAEKDVCNTLVKNSLEEEQELGVRELNPLPAVDSGNSDCPVRFSYPPDLPPRSCKLAVRECSVNWTGDSETSRRCEAKGATRYVYEEPPFDEDYNTVSLGTWIAYRNVHCARCNYVNMQQLRCYTPPRNNGPNFRRVYAASPPRMVPFSVILDINNRQQTVKNNHRGSMEESTFLESCPHGQVYDPFSAICRHVFCNAGFILTSNGCVPKINISLTNNSDFCRNQNNISHCILSLNQTTYNVTRNVTVFFGTFDYYDEIQGVISFICVLISLVCLAVQFVIYMSFSELRNLPGKCVVALVVCLFVGLLMYMLVSPSSHLHPSSCFYTAVLMHYALLAAFFWMNVLALDICSTFTAKTARSSSSSLTSKRFICYSLYAWLVPTIIVGISLTLDLTHPQHPQDDDQLNTTSPTDWGTAGTWAPRYAHTLCWINQSSALLAWFVVPLTVVLLTNLVLFTVSVYSIHRATLASQSAAVKSSYRHHLFIFAKLLVVMGLTWLVGVCATFTNSGVLWYVFIVFNSLQGALIALSFICTKKVIRLIKNRLSSVKNKNKKKGGAQGSYSRSYSNFSSHDTRQTSVL